MKLPLALVVEAPEFDVLVVPVELVPVVEAEEPVVDAPAPLDDKPVVNVVLTVAETPVVGACAIENEADEEKTVLILEMFTALKV